jgi:3-dehydroquinate dehydratase-1
MFEEFVLAAATADPSEAEAAVPAADALEFRMDLADDPLGALSAYDGPLPVIATDRADWEGGEADSLARYERLSEAVAHDPVVAVDVELAALQATAPDPELERSHANALRETARESGVQVIASAHDFESTPPVDALVDLLADAAAAGDVGKVATMAASPDDALAMLRATRRATAAGHTVATMCMGEPGRHTRAVAPVYGSRIGYAPLDPANATAPGQYSLSTLRRLVDDLTRDGIEA